MKYKRISLFLLTAMVVSIVFTGCEDPNPLHTVTFDSAGGSAVAEQTVKDGGTAVKPYEDPTRTGYVFDSWRLGSSADTYSFSTLVTAGIILTAKWLKKGSNDNSSGNGNGNGSGNGDTRPDPAVCANFQKNYNDTKKKQDEA